MSEIEIKNFELRYDGMFHITWNENEKMHKWYIYLPIYQLYWMIEKEGISFKDLYISSQSQIPIKFNKIILKFQKDEGAFEAWGFYEPFEKETLRSEGYKVELLEGDNINRYKNQILLGDFEIDNDDFNTACDIVNICQ